MKFSEHWLREFVDPEIDSETLTRQLTMAGLEVEGVSPACPDLAGLVVAEIKAIEPHPRADKLHVCRVKAGRNALFTVVCGAANIRPGMRAILAKPGAKLPGRPPLQAVSVKGVTSEGMLCAPAEIGLGEDEAGILELSAAETAGRPLPELFGRDDTIIEISVTPNRGDCLSLLGIAREVAVINQLPAPAIPVKAAPVASRVRRTLELTAKEACPHYAGRVIENVAMTARSPLWLREKLRRSGLRTVNIVVDITNYVMLESGQPLHAFDNDRLNGVIRVRYPEAGETITLLDDSGHEIKPATVLIADDSGPLAMAGLMGGKASAVTEKTGHIFLESAFFAPEKMIGQARRYGMQTDASHRFERGVDPKRQTAALERATELILDLCGGQAGPVVEASHDACLPQMPAITLRKTEIKRVLGIEIHERFVSERLKALGMKARYKNNQWLVTPPSYRFDINIEVDLIEELARIYGYDAIAVKTPAHRLKMRPVNRGLQRLERLRDILVCRDYQEVITYGFVAPELNRLFKGEAQTLRLANPIAPELSEMRAGLWPGLIGALQYNIKRQQERARLFETGLVFSGGAAPRQEYRLGGVIYGSRYKKQWDHTDVSSDFYDLKADLEALLQPELDSGRLEFRPAEVNALHPGQAMQILTGVEVIGCFGRLHPARSAALELKENTYLFEINTEKLTPARQTAPAGAGAAVKDKAAMSISRFPPIKRDLSIVIDEAVAFHAVVECVKNDATAWLNELELFDVYRGEGIEKGKKSLALGLTFRATSSTLKDEEIETVMGNITDGLYKKFGARLRE